MIPSVARLFISQERLDTWASEDRIKVEGDVMLLNGDSRSFKLRPAVRFLKVAGDDADPNGLIGKVKTIEALEKDGGEHYMNSVIFGETAYDVQQGFVGDPVIPGA